MTDKPSGKYHLRAEAFAKGCRMEDIPNNFQSGSLEADGAV
jgi:hypothetical protein